MILQPTCMSHHFFAESGSSKSLVCVPWQHINFIIGYHETEWASVGSVMMLCSHSSGERYGNSNSYIWPSNSSVTRPSLNYNASGKSNVLLERFRKCVLTSTPYILAAPSESSMSA